ncbi:NAD-dependent epimerase/dehydratase family protein [Pseudonocardia endophytica]|uniref:dTDP-glucose 4,6-dehydratase/UDP-glucose 4-epimerase n=1 Tax=Pseudonocardia endophytica TaxID=401976 RepID=A0A4R1HXN4_PSEEN|nr:NAD(P)-dependent oxidoreductase [Pseudonocardia endophytica]TCK27554.1 dTDP-glucose 4,6-dehydratase/UDP-glucose 4-epimerase [Pseudonocardia endophytica]
MNDGTVLITGSAGLVGHAVRRLLEIDEVAVAPVDVHARSADGVAQIACDLTDPARLDEVFSSARPHTVVHCGGVSGPMVAPDDPATVVRTNVDGTAALLEAARRHGVTRFVYCSSIAAYGSTGSGPVQEDTPLHPTDVYGATKAAGEHLVEAYRHTHGLSTASLRLVAVYGPRRTTGCAIRDLLTDAAAGRRTRWPVPADAPHQYVHVDDAARSVVAAVRCADAVGAYNVAGGPPVTAAEVVAAVQAVDPRATADLDPADPVAAAGWPGALDTTAARRDLGYEPVVDLVGGVRTYRAGT